MKIVDGVTGEAVCEVRTATPVWAVRDLKGAICEATGILKARQRLIFGGRALRGQESLADVLAGACAAGAAPVRLVQVDPGWSRYLDEIGSSPGLLLGLDTPMTEIGVDPISKIEPGVSPTPGPSAELAMLLASRSFVVALLQENGAALAHVSLAMRADRELVLIAVREAGMSLGFAGDALRDDVEVVSTALRENGQALQFASERLRAQRSLVESAIAQNGAALQFASLELQRDKAVVLKAVAQNGEALRHAALELRIHHGFVREAVACNGDAWKFMEEGMSQELCFAEAAHAYWKAQKPAVSGCTEKSITFLRDISQPTTPKHVSGLLLEPQPRPVAA